MLMIGKFSIRFFVMGTSHVISALCLKRSEMSGEVFELEQRLSNIRKQMSHIDASIKIFDPDFDLRTLPPKRSRKASKHFKHGELNRLLLDTLRKAKKAMTTEDIYQDICLVKGLSDLDESDKRSVKNHIAIALRRQEKSGAIQSCRTEEDNKQVIWKIPSRNA